MVGKEELLGQIPSAIEFGIENTNILVGAILKIGVDLNGSRVTRRLVGGLEGDRCYSFGCVVEGNTLCEQHSHLASEFKVGHSVQLFRLERISL